MTTYWFELEIGPVDDLEDAAERLYSFCGDGQIAGDEHGGTIMFSREALSAMKAILSAIDDSERAGLSVTGVTEDLVTVEDIAEKTARTAQAVGHWVTGERGPGQFPAPVIHRSSRVKLYSWAQVARWLSDARLGEIDTVAAEVASAAAAVDALLRARHVLSDAPTAQRVAMTQLIAGKRQETKTAPLFSDLVREDWTPRRPNESLYAFLDRSATPFFGEVRRLLSEWLDRVPASERPSLVGNLQSGELHSFEAAFWELYLHEAYSRSGHQLVIHPDLPGSPTHPDFLIEGEGGRFYLEAVRVGLPQAKVAEGRRLDEVHAVLDSIGTDQFTVHLSVFSIGPNPLSIKELRHELRKWLKALDPAAVTASLVPGSAFDTLPRLRWAKDDWDLEFHALPLKPQAVGKKHRFVSMLGPGEARIVDNVSGLLRALNAKADKYGALDAPLVIALMSNTEFFTEDDEVEQALFGISVHRPAQAALRPKELIQEGHWLTRSGWRRSHTPQVIAVQDLTPWTITKVRPRLWSTLEPGIVSPVQPTWLGSVTVSGPEAVVSGGQPLSTLFGLPSDWLAGGPELKLEE